MAFVDERLNKIRDYRWAVTEIDMKIRRIAEGGTECSCIERLRLRMIQVGIRLHGEAEGGVRLTLWWKGVNGVF